MELKDFQLHLLDLGISTFNKNINMELFKILESVYYRDNEDDYQSIKEIYSILSDEVDDDEFYDMDYDIDNDDLASVLYNFCVANGIGKSQLALGLGKFLIQTPQRLFKSYEDFHYQIAECFNNASQIPNGYDNALFLSMSLNEIVDADMMVKYADEHNELLYGSED
ncbi:hypothetical protein CHU00_14835 [Sphingobacterium cellulitidis]|uniref:hypothetical protein n=1 Tax=Sphingobacterium cellulitidis TaxID=1768011 RepID=UPI000B93BC4E|nr:hypothetical protein [Sphingobacterium cellulitidis]OYD44887.1 hypothetical protein CHU00_14835 [Sphingobacterium cellulitidis]